MKSLPKSIGAVVAGFVIVFVLSTATDLLLHAIGVIPDGPLFNTPLLLLALAYRTIYTIFGCYIAARLAPTRPLKHALTLGGIGTVVGIMGAIAMRDLGPAWYAWAVALEGLPCAYIGGKIAERKRE